ncbi:MAG TPA: hypothetical protein VHP33_21975 [Polyangiaceae bacterium]|nr:hypothetical protein [Polyangiaceae bacterium]
MQRAFTALLFALFCLAVGPRVAWAQRVLLVRPPASDTAMSEAFNRLRAELQLQDFEVEVLEVDERKLSPDELESAAQQADAFAGITLNRIGSSATADVSIADRVTGKITVRRLAISAGKDSPGILAVRAVDLLRASLRELPVDERPPPDVIGVGSKPAPEAVRAFTQAEPARFQVSAAAVTLGSLREVSNGYGASVGFWYRPTERLQLGFLVVGPLVGARYRSPNGDAVVRQELGQLRAGFNLLGPGVLELGPVLGAGVYHLLAQGDVRAPFTGQSAAVWSFAASGGLEARLRLTETLSLGASLQGLLLTPRPVVAVDSASEELGQPLLLATLGLGVAF